MVIVRNRDAEFIAMAVTEDELIRLLRILLQEQANRLEDQLNAES